MQRIIVDITPGFRMPTIHFSQGDVGTQFAVDLRSRFGDSLPASPTVTIQATKPSGFGFTESATSFTNGVAVFTTTADMTDEAGRFPVEIKVVKDSVTLFSANFYMDGEATTHPDGTIDGQQEQVIPELTQLVERVETAASSVLDMTVEAETLAAGSQATYSYDEDTNTATFGIPQGEAGAGAAGVTANAYSSSATYAVGDYVIHNSNLYRCTTAITTAEAFTAAHWIQVVLADDVCDLKSELTQNINGLGDGRQYFDYTWGSINGDGTINYDYSPKTRVVTPTYMKFGVDTDIRITIAYYCIVALYNNDYSLISRTVYTGTPTATIPADTYFRVCVFHGSIVPNSIYDLSDKVYYDSNVQKSLFGLGFYGSSHLNLSTTINRFDCDISEGDRVKVTVNIETVGTGAKNVQIFYVENGTSTLIETFYANGDYYFYAPTDMSRLAVLLNTAGSITSADVNVTIKTGAYQALDSIPKVYHCEKDGSGDFTKLTDAINTAMQFMDSVVYVGAGTWDLIDELGSAYVETISESNRGLYLKNRVHIICNPDSLITWHYAGSTADVIKWGCAFNSGEYGFTLENAHIETSNCRYTIHDERDYATDFYENKYINCVMKHDNTVGGSKQCIGGGLGKNGRIVVHGCIFENVKYNTETDGGWVVSYHNTWNVDGGKSFIEISDNYFKGNSTMHFGWFGNSTEKTPIICTNNSIGHSIYFERETTEDVGVATDIVNLELFDWNNIIRS